MPEAKNAGEFSNRFLGIASNQNDAGSMQFGITQFGLQGTIHITPKVRESARTEWRNETGAMTECDHAANKSTVITLNTPSTPKNMKKIAQIGRKSADRYDKHLIDSLMTIQTWQQNRADEEECHLPLKFVAFDETSPAAFASLGIYLRDQPQAQATYITCVIDMLAIDAEKLNEGFDMDLSIACAKFLFETMNQVYGALPENRIVVVDVLDEMDSETDREFANHVRQAILDSWEMSQSEEQITRKRIVLEKPLFDFGNDTACVQHGEAPDDDFNF